MTSSKSALLIAALVVAGPSKAELVPSALADPHLTLVARTAEEIERIAKATAPPSDFSTAQSFERLSAGAATVVRRGDEGAFSFAGANVAAEAGLDFELGRAMFEKLWVASPSSTRASDGLGPLYNARSCAACHHNDGRGFADGEGLLLRLSVSALDDGSTPQPDPMYGGQLQNRAAPGMAAEYQMNLRYEEFDVDLSDGERVSLRKPSYEIADLAYGPLADAVMISPRLAPPMIGLGLLEAIPSKDIVALADPEDSSGNGISGRANIVKSAEFGVPMVGRFGWKATLPTVAEQVASAFSADIGLSTPVFPWHWGDCTVAQQNCRGAVHGGDPEREGLEVDSQGFDLTVFYSRNLGVPERGDADDADVLRGKELFHASQCAACHVPAHVTHRLKDRPEQSFQLIWPYTDLLLHDMGPALADGRPDGLATGQEWRTPPLWGIGLTAQVGGRENYLHDGRARSLLEAILWHGGEAQFARDAVVEMSSPDRTALIKFLESL